ncbi:macrophage mannose receptor 1 [Larimichthys crocea]|uniref:macrophage mannose receptor 1 n=1 Tax=Larimichthys crocea TaxID=215358 RepID=UPI000F5EC44D|nr:macrophage mannose receptor 1 [Larimichthys crocea]
MDTHSPQSSIMMERILLGVLYLSGCHIFSSCLLHQYHFVADPMNWTEAQTYCRQTYTDLATIENTEEMQQLINTVPSSKQTSDIWIGVYSNVSWNWSDGYNGSGADYRDWGGHEAIYSYDCVLIYPSHPWHPRPCSAIRPFICNNGTQQDPQFVFVGTRMNWSDAQKYCRENYRDLATARNDAENQEVKNLVYGWWAWNGLFREHLSYWSDGSNYSFSNWKQSFNPDKSIGILCGAAALADSGKWKLSLCGTKLPFVCYSVPPPPGE